MLRVGVLVGKSIKDFLPLLQSLNRRHLSEILWLLFSNGASLILGFAIIKIVATIGTTEYGKYALVLSIVPLANAIIYAPIDLFSQRYYYTFAHDDKKAFFLDSILSIINLLLYVLLPLSIIILLFLKIYMRLELNDFSIYLISLGYILLFTSSIPLLGLLNTMRMRTLVALFASGERIIQLLLLVGVYYLVGLNATLVLLVFLAVAAVSFAAKVKILKKEGGVQQLNGRFSAKQIPKDFYQLLVSFGIPLVGFGILAWVQTNGERWAVQLVMSLDSVGIFCFMAMVATTIITVLQAPISAFLGPIIWEKFSDLHDAPKVAEGMKIIWLNVICCCLITVCGAVFLLISGKYLLTLLGSSVFTSHYQLMPVIFAGIGLYYIGQGMTSVGFGYNKMVKYTLPKVIAAIITIFCYLGGAYYWGLLGVAWGLVLTNATYVFLVIIANNKLMRGYDRLN